MNEPTVEIKHGKRDLSVIDIEKTLDRLADARATITALEAELEAVEQDFNQVFKTYVEQANALETAEKIIKDVSKLQRWTAENMDINTRDVQFTTQPDGEVILFAELEAIIK